MESFTSQDGCPKIYGRITAQGTRRIAFSLKTRSAKMAIVRALFSWDRILNIWKTMFDKNIIFKL